MGEQAKSNIWKIRTVKDYPQAHNHIFIGQVLSQTQSYVRLRCRTFHFGKNINSAKDIKSGGCGVRILPWSRIEIVNELPASFDYNKAELVANEKGQVVLNHDDIECVLSSSYDNRY